MTRASYIHQHCLTHPPTKAYLHNNVCLETLVLRSDLAEFKTFSLEKLCFDLELKKLNCCSTHEMICDQMSNPKVVHFV